LERKKRQSGRNEAKNEISFERKIRQKSDKETCCLFLVDHRVGSLADDAVNLKREHHRRKGKKKQKPIQNETGKSITGPNHTNLNNTFGIERSHEIKQAIGNGDR
jgi:hypothetical protein